MMNIRNWTKLFGKTLFIGGFVTIVAGFAIQWDQYADLFLNFQIGKMVAVSLWLLGMGFIFSVISQMGFFAYLTVHRIGLGIFRSLWSGVQSVLIAFALFDLVYFRYQIFAKEGDPVWPYLIPAFLIFLAGLVIAFWKRKQTNRHSFLPTLFFMTVVTILEWVPVLRVNDTDWLQLMIYPLIVCNSYQILSLPSYLAKSRAEREARQSGPEAVSNS
jgi:hypothetical protein